jgi:hypothetical protein
MTRMRSARWIVERRCAMTKTVRPAKSVSSALLHEELRLGVEARRGFVQEEERRVLEDRPRDRDPLPLAAREEHAPVADLGLVSLGRSWMNRSALAASAAR